MTILILDDTDESSRVPQEHIAGDHDPGVREDLQK